MSRHSLRQPAALTAVMAAGLLGLALAACGGSSSPPRTTTTTQATAPAPTGSGPKGSSVGTGPVRATLIGHDRKPVAGKNWSYVVHVADAKGRPLSGTLNTEFLFQGAVVGKDTPPTHMFSHGGFAEDLKFPVRSVGFPIELQVVVHTADGSVTLHWPVTVHK